MVAKSDGGQLPKHEADKLKLVLADITSAIPSLCKAFGLQQAESRKLANVCYAFINTVSECPPAFFCACSGDRTSATTYIKYGSIDNVCM